VKKPELLAPAGDLEKLIMAVRYGADAVYGVSLACGLRLAILSLPKWQRVLHMPINMEPRFM